MIEDFKNFIRVSGMWFRIRQFTSCHYRDASLGENELAILRCDRLQAKFWHG